MIDATTPEGQRRLDDTLRSSRRARAYEVPLSVWEDFQRAALRYRELDTAIRSAPEYSVAYHARLYRAGELVHERDVTLRGG